MPSHATASCSDHRHTGPFHPQPVEIEPHMVHCPHCGKATRHRVYRSLDHTIYWCQACYVVRSDRPVAVPVDLDYGCCESVRQGRP